MNNNISADCIFVSNLKNTINITRKKIAYRPREKVVPNLTESKVKDNVLWLTFSDGKVTQNLTIPIPTILENKNIIIEKGNVQRACGTWLINNKEYNFLDTIFWLLTERVENYFPTTSKRIYIERLLRSFDYSAAPLVFRNIQRIIDDLVNRLPLVGTDMQAWAMSNRVQILDPKWETLTPKQALEYQKNLNKEMFPWTSIGQSDSGMCNNTLLKVDVRKTVPFGLSHHNPRRNLYQTLGMVGDEKPVVMSVSEKTLADSGIVRTGWNLMTVFVDMPLNFEDQIIVNSKLKHLFITEYKSFTCYGTVLPKEEDSINFLHPLSIEPDGTVVRYNINADSSIVKSIERTQINFNGSKTDVSIVTIEYKRLFKDGFKLTNRHGNKGIIFMTDTGVVHDPVRGDIPIDVIVSAQSVKKRKNFGQLFEALTTLLNGVEKKLVIKDNFVAHLDNINKALINKGYSKDGTLNISTRWGKYKAVCGWVHWGCIKTPEDQIWTKFDTNSTNNKDVRTAGNKISHIELKSLITIFGKSNPIVQEIMEHWQGYEAVFESLKILNTLKDKNPVLPVIDVSQINYINQNSSFFHDLVELTGSISDESFMPEGFFVSLPEDYCYVVRRTSHLTFAEDFMLSKDVEPNEDQIVLNKILIPKAFMRKPWKHQSGKYGLTEVSALANAVVGSILRFTTGESKPEQIGRAIYLYFKGLSSMLSSKTGTISNYCMSIRYPFTVKGTASIGENLSHNEIEIHENMAKDLHVKNGDFVLVERFPCLGFMSIRVQKVRVTTDENAKYVIRVSGNSLASQALDFDGDVLYLMSFHSVRSKEALQREFYAPHQYRSNAYKSASDRKEPCFKEVSLEEYGIEIFPEITAEQNADIVEGLTGIKRGTGTIIALCYNIMRILEKNVGYDDEGVSASLEMLLDKVANSVFSMKHAGRSLEAECREAICTADINKMVDLDFDPDASIILSKTIKNLAKKCGINQNSLKEHFEKSEKEGKSSIINIIIRKFHKVWFTSRSQLHPILMLENLNTDPEDLSGWLFYSAKCKWEKENEQKPILGQLYLGR